MGAGVIAGLDALLPDYTVAAQAPAGIRKSGIETKLGKNERAPAFMDLHVRRELVAIAGGHAKAITVNHSVPAPLIELQEGQQAHIRIHNHLDEDTSVHWHGILLPFEMDGVPGVSFPGIKPGHTFEASFRVRQNGTYWYHSHSGAQEQKGLAGPLIIHPASKPLQQVDRDYVIQLSDWTFEDPERVMAQLKDQDDYYNYHQRTVSDLFSSIEKNGWMATLKNRWAWNGMRMSPRDIADVTGATYTYLMNGYHPVRGWEGRFKANERVRLRVINGSAMTYFNFRIPGLTMTVVSADGRDIEPVSTDEFQIGVAETYDVIVEPQADRAYTLMAESMDRSGYAVGTLAPRPGMRAPIPVLRKPPQRTMIDMGMPMPMSGQDSGAMSDNMKGKKHAMMANNKSPVVAHGPHPDYGAQNIAAPEVYRNRLGEPGTGLEHVNHRTLTYDQLRNVLPMQDKRAPQHTIELHLTGNMDRYIWSFNGKKYSESEPIDVVVGDRIRLVLLNDTMMEHPIHLHGMFMELENDQGDRLPFKHTISVLPASRVSLLITANEPGRWPLHCHMLYHMEAGMFRVVRVAKAEDFANA